MVKKLVIIILLLYAGVYYLQAQCCGSAQKMIQQITASPLKMYYLKNDGSPFLTKEWVNASITLISGETYYDLKVKLDLFKDELVYYNPVIGKQLVIDKPIIKEIRLKLDDLNREYLIQNIVGEDTVGKPKYEFFFIHVSDSISLWSTHRKREVQYNEVSNLKGAQGYYYDISKYYIVINKELFNMPSQKRKFAKFFPENRKEILSFIKKQKLDLSNDYDLGLLFVKLNELKILSINREGIKLGDSIN